MNDDRLLDFVKSRLETDEGISSIGLDRLLTQQKHQGRERGNARR